MPEVVFFSPILTLKKLRTVVTAIKTADRAQATGLGFKTDPKTGNWGINSGGTSPLTSIPRVPGLRPSGIRGQTSPAGPRHQQRAQSTRPKSPFLPQKPSGEGTAAAAPAACRHRLLRTAPSGGLGLAETGTNLPKKSRRGAASWWSSDLCLLSSPACGLGRGARSGPAPRALGSPQRILQQSCCSGAQEKEEAESDPRTPGWVLFLFFLKKKTTWVC